MKNVFFDERCLTYADLKAVLSSWRQIVDFASVNATGLTLFLDRHAVGAGEFLKGLNALSADHRILFLPMLFGSEHFNDWRPLAIGSDTICQLATEGELVVDSAICEAYGHRKTHATTALIGHATSSYANRQSVGVRKLDPPENPLDVDCGTSLTDIQRIGGMWLCLLAHYDLGLTRPPQDQETVLCQAPERFSRVGRFERNGRRNVYRETATNRLFYVDNLHYGAAAHLEVFDANELHLGTADLNGNFDPSTLVPGRKVSW